MTTVASAVLFRSESKGSGFHANERPLCNHRILFIGKSFHSHKTKEHPEQRRSLTFWIQLYYNSNQVAELSFLWLNLDITKSQT